MKRTRNQKWSDEEIEFLRANAELGAAKLGEILGATEHAIRQIASRKQIPLIVAWSHSYDFDCADCGKTVTVQRLRNRQQRQSMCNSCRHVRFKREHGRSEVSNEQTILYKAKERAKRRGIPFALTINDIVIPDVCPVLGIKLSPRKDGVKGAADNSPTLDRIVPELGYVPGNVAVISWRANKLKSDASLDELQAVVRWYSQSLS